MEDFGNDSDASATMPTMLILVPRLLKADAITPGIGICGSGNGINMTRSTSIRNTPALC